MANNRFRLRIESAQAGCDRWHWGVKPVDVIKDLGKEIGTGADGFDSRGKCVVLEKLEAGLDRVGWESLYPRLNKSEIRQVLAIANHLYCMQQWNAIPENFENASLMFNAEGMLKSVKSMPKAAFNYNVLERFCCKLAKGNRNILNFLMNVSRLANHDVARFYRGSVEYTLETGETDLLGRALPEAYRNPAYEKHAEDLCECAQKLRVDSYEMVVGRLMERGEYQILEWDPDDSELRGRIALELVHVYKASSTPGVLSEEMRDTAIRNFFEKRRVVPDEGIQKYYDKWFNRMMENNYKAKEL